MKIRLSIWILLVLALGLVAIAVWLHGGAHRSGRLVMREPSPPPSNTPAPRHSGIWSVRATPEVAYVGRTLSPAVQTILDESAGYPKREAALRALGYKLSAADLEVLYALLRKRGADDAGQVGQVFKNGLMDQLCQMEPPPAGLRELLTQVYQDTSQDIVLRDYAVQHLAAFYRQMASAPDMNVQTRNDELSQAQQVLWAAVNETGSSISGSAILGLMQLAQQGWPGMDPSRIGDAALKLARDDSAGELTRITAFQACASLGVTNALPYVLGAAQQGETVAVQISAIGALGALGGQAQVPLLNSLLQGNDERLKLPVRRALEQIAQRQPRGA